MGGETVKRAAKIPKLSNDSEKNFPYFYIFISEIIAALVEVGHGCESQPALAPLNDIEATQAFGFESLIAARVRRDEDVDEMFVATITAK